MSDLFAFSVSPLELIVRGSILYVGLVLVLRFVLRRDVGSMSVADVLFIVLVADASQNAMAGDYVTVTDGIVLISTLVGWNLLLDWLSYRFSAFRRFVEPPSLPLIQDGQWVRRNLKHQWITTEEVMSKLREQGIDDLSVIHLACLEPSGEIAVIRIDKAVNHKRAKPVAGAA